MRCSSQTRDVGERRLATHLQEVPHMKSLRIAIRGMLVACCAFSEADASDTYSITAITRSSDGHPEALFLHDDGDVNTCRAYLTYEASMRQI